MESWRERYRKHMRSRRWREICQRELRRAGDRCEECGEREGLEVHHLTYVNLGDERPGELRVLCEGCHWQLHRERREERRRQRVRAQHKKATKRRRKKLKNLGYRIAQPKTPTKRKRQLAGANEALHARLVRNREHRERHAEEIRKEIERDEVLRAWLASERERRDRAG